MSVLEPRPEHRFSFGLWTVGHRGGDPFGGPTRPALDPAETVRQLAELGVWGVSLHDDDLVPPDATSSERSAIISRFQRALEETGMVVSMATQNLFGHPAFKDGAFTSNDPEVRRFAIAKTMRAIDLGVELGAGIHVFWGGREGVETLAAKPPMDALKRYREALDFLCGHVRDQGHPTRFALEPKPNEPRGDMFLPTIGHALAFIQTLEHPEMVGVNPEAAHETMVGLSFYHGVAQAIEAGKLFHIDLNAQRIGRYDQDFRFGAQDLGEAFFLVMLLEESGYAGPRHFDARPYRVETGGGVWEFAAGCMRTYLALAEKARRFREDPEIRGALESAGAPALAEPTVGTYSRATADALLATRFDPDALAERGYHNDRLDQSVVELILGLR